MRIALAQLNPTVGDCDGNLAKVLAALDGARRQDAELVVFPEQILIGYSAEDLWERDDIASAAQRALERVVAASEGLAVVLGTSVPADGDGKPFHNSALFIADRDIRQVQHKSLLPTYDVFDEVRYFRPASSRSVVEYRGLRLGLAVCEDLWNDPIFWRARNYSIDPITQLAAEGIDWLVSISASPFSVGRPAFRRELVSNTARRHGVGVAYCNQVGGNTTLVFDGNSLAVDAEDRLLAVGASFEEDLVVFDTDGPAIEPPTRFVVEPERLRRESVGAAADLPDSEVEQVWNALVRGTRDYLEKSGFEKAVLGVSGGIDSALVAVIAAEAIGPQNVVGVSLPSRYSSEGSLDDAWELKRLTGIRLHQIGIEAVHRVALETLEPVFAGQERGVTDENLQARIRGLLLMALSNQTGAILLTTGNKSELAVGYCTLYGDMCGGLAVISDVPKQLVYRLARWRNRQELVIPEATISKPPSAELRPDQKDEDSLPPYEVLDAILDAYIERGLSVDEMAAEGLEAELVEKIVRLVDLNDYKRNQAAPGLRVTAKAFGPGRRFPIVKRIRT